MTAKRPELPNNNTTRSSTVDAVANTTRSSTIGAPVNTTRSSTVTINREIAALDRERAQKGMTHADLCRGTGLSENHWSDLRAGRVQPRDHTIQKIKRWIAGTVPTVAPDVIAATHRFAMLWLAKETDADVDLVMAQDFSCERPRDPVWLLAARLRSYAIYITAVELQVPNAALGRAIGCSRQNIKQRRDWVEEQRGEGNLDALLDRCGRLATGRSK